MTSKTQPPQSETPPPASPAQPVDAAQPAAPPQPLKPPAAATAANAADEALESRQQERATDLVRDSLAEENALQANLGAINGELIRLAHRLRPSLGTHTSRTADTPWDEDALPAVREFLAVVKQIERFSQLQIKLRQLAANA